MKRRNFIKTLSLATVGLLTGCSVTNFNLEENEGKINLDKYYKELAFIDMVKISYQAGLKDMELAGFGFKNENAFTKETVYTLPWYLGPDLTITKEKYLLNIYNRDNLLFMGHGLNSKTLFLIRDFLPENYNEKSKSLGFKDFNNLYNYLFSKIANYSRDSIFVFIKKLQDNKLVSNNVYNQVNFDNKLNLLINKFYATYIRYEMSLTVDELNNRDLKTGEFPIDNWLLNGVNTVSYKKDDFYIYNLVNILCIEVLNSKEGLSIYEY